MIRKLVGDRSILILLVGGTLLVAIIATVISNKDLREANGEIYNLIIFRHLFSRFDISVGWLSLGAVVLCLLCERFVPDALIDMPLNWIAAHPRLFAFIAFALIAAATPYAYGNYPLSIDEFAPAFQSKVFAAGHLVAVYPHEIATRMVPMPGEFLKVSKVTGEIISGPWPAWALLLTPFTLLGIPWLLNPIVCATTLLLLAHLAAKLIPQDPLAPAWAMLLALASPQFVAYGVSYYSMGPHLCAALAYAALFLNPTPKRLFAAGLVGGAALCLNNPFPHAVFALPWIVWLAVQPNRVRNFTSLALGYLPFAMLGLAWIWKVGSIATQTAAIPAAQVAATSAVHSQIINQVFHIPSGAELGRYVETRLIWLCKLVGWAVPGLALVCVLGYRQLRAQPAARLLLFSFFATWIAYSFVRVDQGHGWGARYFHIVWGVIPLLGAAWITSDPVGRRWARCFGLLTALSLFLLVPDRLHQMHEFISEAKSQQPPHDPNGREAIFVDKRAGGGRYWAQDAVRNDPFLRDWALVFSSKSLEEDAALMDHFFPGSQRISVGPHGTVWTLPPPSEPVANP